MKEIDIIAKCLMKSRVHLSVEMPKETNPIKHTQHKYFFSFEK
jgi:hypothetical protein